MDDILEEPTFEPLTQQQIDLVIAAMHDSMAVVESALAEELTDESRSTIARNVAHLQGLTTSPVYNEVSLLDQQRCEQLILQSTFV